MTAIYKTGTVSVNNGSNIVTGNGTSFIDVANVQEGDLFTVDGQKFYEAYEVDTNTQIKIRNIVTGGAFAETNVTAGNFAIIRNFTSQTSAEIAGKVLAVQQKWMNREEEMTDWFYTANDWATVTSINGDELNVMTPNGINNLLAPGAFGPDCTEFGFASEAIAMPNNDFAQITDKTAHYFADVNSLNGPPVAGNYQVFALSRTDTAGDTFNYGSVLCIHRDNGTIYNASVNNGVWNWYLNFSTKNLGTVVADSTSVNGSQDAVKFRSDKGGVDFSNDTTSGVNPITFFNPNGAVGSISTSGTATSYNTSSDPRLKTPVPGALSDADINAKFNALLSTFLRFHWINDPNGPEVWGFDAHAVIDAGLDMGTEGEGPRESELGDEYEPAVYDGDELVTPAKVVTPAGVDQAKAVPILLQKIAQLESRLAVLEGN